MVKTTRKFKLINAEEKAIKEAIKYIIDQIDLSQLNYDSIGTIIGIMIDEVIKAIQSKVHTGKYPWDKTNDEE